MQSAQEVVNVSEGPRGATDSYALPAHLVLSLKLAQAEVKLAQAAYDKLALQIERDSGIRFADVIVHPDGTLTPKQ